MTKLLRADQLAARAILERSVTEADWQRTVTDALTVYGWRWCHFRPARTAKGWRTPIEGTPGWVDLVAVRVKDGVGRLLMLELKSERGQLSDDQAVWLAALRAVPGIEAYVVKPSQWDELVEALA